MSLDIDRVGYGNTEVNWSPAVSRRAFMSTVLAVISAAACKNIPDLPTPLPNPVINQGGIQDKYVGEILEIEEGFNDKKLVTGDPILRRHTALVAGMFAEYYHTGQTPDELVGTVLLIPTTEQFIKYLKQSGNMPQNPSERNVRNPIAQYTNQGIATINLGHEVFDMAVLRKGIRLGHVPSAWNPLRELRITQTHEWGHDTRENSKDPILKRLDPENKYPDKRFSGFRVNGFADASTGGVQLADINTRLRYIELDEASVELISAKPNNDLFPSDRGFYSTYPDFHGNPKGVSEIGNRLNRLRDATRINPLALFQRHRNSEAGEFFYLILEKTGLTAKEVFLRPFQVKALIDTIISGDPKQMQSYIDGALRTIPD